MSEPFNYPFREIEPTKRQVNVPAVIETNPETGEQTTVKEPETREQVIRIAERPNGTRFILEGDLLALWDRCKDLEKQVEERDVGEPEQSKPKKGRG